jgi:hypothetical protein
MHDAELAVLVEKLFLALIGKSDLTMGTESLTTEMNEVSRKESSLVE